MLFLFTFIFNYLPSVILSTMLSIAIIRAIINGISFSSASKIKVSVMLNIGLLIVPTGSPFFVIVDVSEKKSPLIKISSL